MFDTIQVTAEGTRGEPVVDRPDTLSPHALREIAQAVRWFDHEPPEVRVVVVPGRGRAFSAGADIGAGDRLSRKDTDAAGAILRLGPLTRVVAPADLDAAAAGLAATIAAKPRLVRGGSVA